MIQLNSHFGRPVREWTDAASKLALCFSLVQEDDILERNEKIRISTLITDQNQPVFCISLTLRDLAWKNCPKPHESKKIEVRLEEIIPIHEDYELTLVLKRINP